MCGGHVEPTALLPGTQEINRDGARARGFHREERAVARQPGDGLAEEDRPVLPVVQRSPASLCRILV